MSLKIKKKTGEIFDLPQDYVIEAEKNNPAFTTSGSKTITINFPATDNNRKLLLNTERLDKAERPETFPVLVESDAYQQQGLMTINSGFNAGIGFDEAELYNKMGTIKLKDLPGLPVLEYSGTLEQKLDYLLSYLTDVMKNETVADFYVFPVILQYEKVDSKEYYIIVNELDLTIDPENLPNGRLAELSGLNRRIMTVYDSEEIQLDVPRGFGISPFLKVHKILQLIFSYFGYTIVENPFAEYQLGKLVLLNNVMDTVVTGVLNYKDMMPDVTVNEFFDYLYNKFGMKYYINSNAKTVRLRFINNLLRTDIPDYIDLNEFKTEELIINYSSLPKQLKLTANREIESSKTPYNTFEKFLQEYDQFTEYNGINITEGVVNLFDKIISRYYVNNPYNGSTVINSSDFFDWDKENDIEYEEIKMDDLSVPLMRYKSGHTYLAFLLGYRLNYTENTNKESDNDNTISASKIAFAFGFKLTQLTNIAQYNYFFASQINRDEFGNFIYDGPIRQDISLTINREDGLYNRFWKHYDSFIRHSNFEVKCKLKMSESSVLDYDISKQKLINNQPLITKQIKFRMNQSESIPEFSFLTTKLYQPYDLVAEQMIPTYENQRYYWKWVRTRVPDPDVLLGVGNYHVIEGATNEFVIVIIDDEPVEIEISKLIWKIPTELQFTNNEQRIFTYNFKVMDFATHSIYDIVETITYTPEEIVY
ncbi:MAG: hypothetical protein Q7J05_04030 [Paludibacter sp.]|nr:hypothetical protein [Paludibacter sp.]